MGKQKINVVRVDPNAEFKKRVFIAKSKPTFPLNYRQIIFKHYPEYDTPANRKHLSNVMVCSSPDYRLTLIIEAIAAGKLTLAAKPVEHEIVEH